MADFVTVYEISRWSNGLLADELFRLAVGVVALVGGMTGLLYKWRQANGSPWTSIVSSLFVTAWAVIWLAMHNFPAMYQRIEHLATAYEAGRCEVSEGIVSVKHEQPKHGHTSGDRIAINGQEFVVDYFHATPAYHDTIAHGGVLRPGVYARLCHIDGAIVRVELRNDHVAQH